MGRSLNQLLPEAFGVDGGKPITTVLRIVVDTYRDEWPASAAVHPSYKDTDLLAEVL